MFIILHNFFFLSFIFFFLSTLTKLYQKKKKKNTDVIRKGTDLCKYSKFISFQMKLDLINLNLNGVVYVYTAVILFFSELDH